MRAALLALTALTSCSVLTDLDGFVSPAAPAPEVEPSSEAPAAVVHDAGHDAGSSTSEAGTAPARSCRPTVLVGNDAIAGSVVDDINGAVADVFGYAAKQDGLAECAWVYLETAPAAVHIGVYAPRQQGGAEKLLARVTIAAPKKGWNSGLLDRPLAIIKGEARWLSVSPLEGHLQNRAFERSCGDLFLRATGSGPTGTPDPYPAGADTYEGFCDALMYLSPAQ